MKSLNRDAPDSKQIDSLITEISAALGKSRDSVDPQKLKSVGRRIHDISCLFTFGEHSFEPEN